jgi:hypothetical protein
MGNARDERRGATDSWEGRRKRYNVALALAGLGAFACYVAVIEHYSCIGIGCVGRADDTEITVVTILFQVVGYLMAMGVANVLFGLGAFSERLIRPSNVPGWRRTTFTLGLSLSVALPFLVPALLAFRLAQ